MKEKYLPYFIIFFSCYCFSGNIHEQEILDIHSEHTKQLQLREKQTKKLTEEILHEKISTNIVYNDNSHEEENNHNFQKEIQKLQDIIETKNQK